MGMNPARSFLKTQFPEAHKAEGALCSHGKIQETSLKTYGTARSDYNYQDCSIGRVILNTVLELEWFFKKSKMNEWMNEWDDLTGSK